LTISKKGVWMKRQPDRVLRRHDQKRIDTIRKNIPDDTTLLRQTQLFMILSDPTRLKIVMALRNSELCVHEITGIAGPSLSAVSHQLRLLKTMRLVKFRKQGKEVYYTLDDDHIEKLIDLAAEHIDEK
jgi:DNA-binding transcriptional ArsR family regulator